MINAVTRGAVILRSEEGGCFRAAQGLAGPASPTPAGGRSSLAAAVWPPVRGALGRFLRITAAPAMMPVVGAALIYVPLTIMMFVQGHTGKGIAMAVWGFGFIGLVDNLFRFILNKRLGDIHPLITIFGVIVGIQLFGFIGLIFGPLLISMFILLLRIYGSEFIVKKRVINRVK